MSESIYLPWCIYVPNLPPKHAQKTGVFLCKSGFILYITINDDCKGKSYKISRREAVFLFEQTLPSHLGQQTET